MADKPKLLLFSGTTHPALAHDIANRLEKKLGEVEIKTFANGETYVRYGQSLRGANVYLISSPYKDINGGLMELLIMIDAARRGSAKTITAVIPHYPYARQDKKSSGREPITAKLVATMLEAAGATRVLSMDLHAGQIQGFFQVPMDHMTGMTLLADHFQERGLHGRSDVVIVSPDAGRVKLARRFADRLGASLAVLTKERPAHNVAAVSHVIGDVKGKTAIMIDDMIDTAGTLCAGAEALHDAGATSIYAAATHAVFSGEAHERIQKSRFQEVIVTDTVPVEIQEGERITVIPSGGVFASTIHRLWTNDSVSEIFGGDNFRF